MVRGWLPQIVPWLKLAGKYTEIKVFIFAVNPCHNHIHPAYNCPICGVPKHLRSFTKPYASSFHCWYHEKEGEHLPSRIKNKKPNFWKELITTKIMQLVFGCQNSNAILWQINFSAAFPRRRIAGICKIWKIHHWSPGSHSKCFEGCPWAARISTETKKETKENFWSNWKRNLKKKS